MGLRSPLNLGVGGTGRLSGPPGGGGGGFDDDPESLFHTKCQSNNPTITGPKAIITLKI